MYEDAKASKRSGLRVLMVTPGDVDADDVERIRCANCNGVGTLALQTLIGGPYDDPPAANPENNVHIGVHNGKWYRMTLKTYSCPLCTKEIVL